MNMTDLRSHITHSLHQGECALCGTRLDAKLEEVPCPHWFLLPGRTAFEVRKLCGIFALYDFDTVISYLKLAGHSFPPSRRGGLAHEEVTVGGNVETHIRCGKRSWIFETRAERDSTAVKTFWITTLFKDQLVEKACISIESGHAVIKEFRRLAA